MPYPGQHRPGCASSAQHKSGIRYEFSVFQRKNKAFHIGIGANQAAFFPVESVCRPDFFRQPVEPVHKVENRLFVWNGYGQTVDGVVAYF